MAKDIVVNGTATGPFGGGILLESGDSITVETVSKIASHQTMTILYNGSPKDVLGGVMVGDRELNWYYEFSDNTVLNKNGSGKNFVRANESMFRDSDGSTNEGVFLPPAKDVIEVGIGHYRITNSLLGAEIILKN